VAAEVMDDPTMLDLGGEERDLTVLFADIRGFTTMSEQFTANELTQFLNEYFTPMTAIIFESGGTLDKYMGDAIMAFYGAPTTLEDHAVRSCKASLDMVKELEILNAQWTERGLLTIDIGIGCNSGPMRVGNMGSKQRMDYTVMGDNVNLGSRLEGINKAYGTRICVSEYTVELAKEEIHFRELDAVRVKGKTEPVRIFEVVGEGKEPSAEDGPWIQAYEEGLQLYRQQAFDRAIERFNEVLGIRDDDFAARVFVDRCRALSEEPPGEGWDGVFVMKTK